MKLDSRDVALWSVFTALYVIINFAQMFSVGNPTVYGPVQLRVADCLIALAALFGWPLIAGVTVGCFLTNAYAFIGFQDVILGPIANLIAAMIIFRLRRHRFLACVVGSLPIGLIVGGYLWMFFPPPDVLRMLPVWGGMIVSITVSTLISVALMGYTLLRVLEGSKVMETLESRGLKPPKKERG
ncbi:MAG: QueT transporter family protein [Thermoproteota archaeon]